MNTEKLSEKKLNVLQRASIIEDILKINVGQKEALQIQIVCLNSAIANKRYKAVKAFNTHFYRELRTRFGEERRKYVFEYNEDESVLQGGNIIYNVWRVK